MSDVVTYNTEKIQEIEEEISQKSNVEALQKYLDSLGVENLHLDKLEEHFEIDGIKDIQKRVIQWLELREILLKLGFSKDDLILYTRYFTAAPLNRQEIKKIFRKKKDIKVTVRPIKAGKPQIKKTMSDDDTLYDMIRQYNYYLRVLNRLNIRTEDLKELHDNQGTNRFVGVTTQQKKKKTKTTLLNSLMLLINYVDISILASLIKGMTISEATEALMVIAAGMTSTNSGDESLKTSVKKQTKNLIMAAKKQSDEDEEREKIEKDGRREKLRERLREKGEELLEIDADALKEEEEELDYITIAYRMLDALSYVKSTKIEGMDAYDIILDEARNTPVKGIPYLYFESKYAQRNDKKRIARIAQCIPNCLDMESSKEDIGLILDALSTRLRKHLVMKYRIEPVEYEYEIDAEEGPQYSVILTLSPTEERKLPYFDVTLDIPLAVYEGFNADFVNALFLWKKVFYFFKEQEKKLIFLNNLSDEVRKESTKSNYSIHFGYHRKENDETLAIIDLKDNQITLGVDVNCLECIPMENLIGATEQIKNDLVELQSGSHPLETLKMYDNNLFFELGVRPILKMTALRYALQQIFPLFSDNKTVGIVMQASEQHTVQALCANRKNIEDADCYEKDNKKALSIGTYYYFLESTIYKNGEEPKDDGSFSITYGNIQQKWLPKSVRRKIPFSKDEVFVIKKHMTPFLIYRTALSEDKKFIDWDISTEYEEDERVENENFIYWSSDTICKNIMTHQSALSGAGWLAYTEKTE